VNGGDYFLQEQFLCLVLCCIDESSQTYERIGLAHYDTKFNRKDWFAEPQSVEVRERHCVSADF
jgi:hypothetical protein